MKYELIGRPAATEAVRHAFEAFLVNLEATPSTKVSVVFGFAWGNHIYEHDWLALELTGSELRARVAAAEASGLGRIGSDDLFVTLRDLRIELTYCHDADIHVTADVPAHPYLEDQRQRWIEDGWEVLCREVA